MRLGFYTDYSAETAEFAQKVGFKSMELSAWPGSALDASVVTDKRIAEILADLNAKDIQVSALGYYPNYLYPDPKESREAKEYFLKVLDLAVRMNVKTVCTFVGRDPDKSVEENIPAFKEVFTHFTAEAEKRGVRIAIENCPMMGHRRMKSENIAYSPEIWDRMFAEVPSPNLGIELDPAHMVWLGIDYVQAIYDYGKRIFHVHAKDMEIRRDVLARVGIYGQAFGDIFGLGHGWWRARTPGWGEVDWPRLITALIEVGYDGNLDIEHEDDVYGKAIYDSGTVKEEADIVAAYGREDTGLILGYKTLSQLLP